MATPLQPESDPATTARAVIIHADDVGMCHSANVAFRELSERGLITCGSVMVPCPWFLEAAAMARENSRLDLGVHLTLTAEWKYFRWGPISTRDRASGLIDDEGYFWHRTHMVQDRLNVTAIEEEFRAQIERALDAEIDITHLDSHMGVTAIPELMELTARLGREYRVPVLAFSNRSTYLPYMDELGVKHEQLPDLDAITRDLVDAGMPLVDDFRISPRAPSERADAVYREMMAKLPAGLTFFSLHPSTPGDIDAIVPDKSFYRKDEYRLLQDPALREFVAAQKIRLVGYRELRDKMRLQKEMH